MTYGAMKKLQLDSRGRHRALGHVPSFHDVYETINHDKVVDAFAKTAFLKLNAVWRPPWD